MDCLIQHQREQRNRPRLPQLAEPQTLLWPQPQERGNPPPSTVESKGTMPFSYKLPMLSDKLVHHYIYAIVFSLLLLSTYLATTMYPITKCSFHGGCNQLLLSCCGTTSYHVQYSRVAPKHTFTINWLCA